MKDIVKLFEQGIPRLVAEKIVEQQYGIEVLPTLDLIYSGGDLNESITEHDLGGGYKFHQFNRPTGNKYHTHGALFKDGRKVTNIHQHKDGDKSFFAMGHNSKKSHEGHKDALSAARSVAGLKEEVELDESVISHIKTNNNWDAAKNPVNGQINVVYKTNQQKVPADELFDHLSRIGTPSKDGKSGSFDGKGWQVTSDGHVAGKAMKEEVEYMEESIHDKAHKLILDSGVGNDKEPHWKHQRIASSRVWTRGDGSRYKDEHYISHNIGGYDTTNEKSHEFANKLWDHLVKHGKHMGTTSGEFRSDEKRETIKHAGVLYHKAPRSHIIHYTSPGRTSGVWNKNVKENFDELDEQFYTVHKHNDKGQPSFSASHTTKYSGSAISHALSHTQAGRSVTVFAKDHKGVKGSVVVNPGDNVKAKIATLQEEVGVKELTPLMESTLKFFGRIHREDLSEKHDDEKEDKVLIKKMVKKDALKKDEVKEGVLDKILGTKVYSVNSMNAETDAADKDEATKLSNKLNKNGIIANVKTRRLSNGLFSKSKDCSDLVKESSAGEIKEDWRRGKIIPTHMKSGKPNPAHPAYETHKAAYDKANPRQPRVAPDHSLKQIPSEDAFAHVRNLGVGDASHITGIRHHTIEHNGKKVAAVRISTMHSIEPEHDLGVDSPVEEIFHHVVHRDSNNPKHLRSYQVA